MVKAIELPKLNALTPSLDSTLLKLVEEAGELARAVMAFLPYERLSVAEINELSAARKALNEVNGELLDVAQTCVTMVFVLEESYGIRITAMLDEHLNKLSAKGYRFSRCEKYAIEDCGGAKRLALPRLLLSDVTLLSTVCKIQEEIGEFTQFLGKKAGASGEKDRLNAEQIRFGCALELLDIAQCCFTMMYILADRYEVAVEKLAAAHLEKLRRKGYCR